MDQKPRDNSIFIKQLALKYGFETSGISKAGFLEEEAPRLESWLKNGYHGKMAYMENYFDKRLDPTLLMPSAKTVISFLYNYYPGKEQSRDSFNIAKYAYGEDYHIVIREKLNELLSELRSAKGEIEARVFVDSAPVLERAWAEKSGLGWIGKHGLLINKQKGSWFFLAEIITDLECEPDGPVKDFCGTCTRCVDACPTDAILPDKTLNASKCISYLTIELKDQIPEEFKQSMNDWIFGCDICQDVCPWNRFSSPHNEKRFEPKDEMMKLGREEWKVLSEETYSKLFKNSAIKRTKYSGLMRNIRFVSQSTADDESLELS